ncbi:hypothetical protein COS75_01265 [Candidatus Pacearchaeota archaeon CG06_land_8_20_14_3_00_35_12]|nr:MAG: hypothetical protein COS75_01265 [Candidatus Pacearchaeota archaeon CG06_land_8_20_14_3_00_35_12]
MENQIVKLIAEDRLQVPMSSLEQKVRKSKMSDAKSIAEMIGEKFDGNRVYAFIEEEDKDRARGMKEAVAEFEQEFPKYGAILKGKINEKRKLSEKYLYFGLYDGCKLTSEDYLGVLQNIGLTERAARELYPELLNLSRKLVKEKGEERSIIVGTY